MSNTRYRRGKLYAADMAVYSRQMSADNSREISRLRHNLIRALQEDVTEKQRKALLLYYAEGYNMREIGERMGVDKSTVSRTIKRGERRLQRCLRYGAAYLLDELREAPCDKIPSRRGGQFGPPLFGSLSSRAGPRPGMAAAVDRVQKSLHNRRNDKI